MVKFQQSQQDILLRKITKRKDEIAGYIYSRDTPITDIVFRQTTKYESYDEAVAAHDYKPISVGDSWGPSTNAWFKARFSVPESFAGRAVFAFFDFGGWEACAFLDGKPFHGIGKRHKYIPLLTKAKGGESFELVFDAICGSPWGPEKSDNEFPRSAAVFTVAHLAVRNDEVADYWYDLEVMRLLAEQLAEDSPRRAKIIYTLNESVDAFDYTNTDENSLARSANRARTILRTLYNCKTVASVLKLAVVGHSHIDVAWKWPYRETKRKCARTFSSQLRLMELYPEFIYTQGQAILYEFVKAQYPELYEDIKNRVKEGRWDVTGSMYVEADCNLSSGESLIRQILVGKNFYRDEFGIETDVLWLPDVFGYSAALPQILKRARIHYFFTNKIHWSDINCPPYGTFYWKGIDGSRVLAHFPPSASYNGFPDPAWLTRYAKYWQDKDRANEILFTYGWGDGGGGPEDRHCEYLRRQMDLEGLPKLEHKKVSEFFRDIDNGADYNEWVGELYLEYHRGTYTTQARNKKLNRRSEFLYRDAEILSSIAASMGLYYPRDQLTKQWKQILAMQFHDVIPGTSIRQVYEDTEKIYAEVLAVGRTIVDSALRAIANSVSTSADGQAIVVFNTLAWDRKGVVEAKLPRVGNYAVLNGNGTEVACQIVGDVIRFCAEVPSIGYATYRLVEKASVVKPTLKVSKTTLENRFFRIELDNKGLIKSLVCKGSGRQVLPEGARANVFEMYEDKPLSWPAWDVDFFHLEKFEQITDFSSLSIVEEGPVRGALEIERKFGNSHLIQRVVIYEELPRIDFETWVDWRENEKLLKVAFPVDVNADKARYEIQFGNVERPTHRNTSWDFAKFEVCAHKWADLSESGFGVSLMNDCKYGHSILGNVMRLTLLKSAKQPDPEADMLEHTFTYSLMPHAGDYVTAQTVRRAYELNVDMPTILATASPGKRPASKSFVRVDTDNVVLETIKRAELEDATILRFYECHNKRAKVNVTLDLPFKKVFECDLMEDDLSEIESRNGQFSFEIKPFEIRTFKMR